MDDPLTTLARALVERGAFRWQAGMLATDGHRLDAADLDHAYAYRSLPDLTDTPTARIIAGEAMEAGCLFRYLGCDWSWSLGDLDDGTKACGGVCPTLGEAAARALLAVRS